MTQHLDTQFRFSFSTMTPAKPVTSFTSPFLKAWRVAHALTCRNHGERCHTWRGLHFGDPGNPKAYFDIECLGCHEHYVELAPSCAPSQ
jgi:hypothetical protein